MCIRDRTPTHSSSKPAFAPTGALGCWPASDTMVSGCRIALGCCRHALVILGKSLALDPHRWHPSLTCPRSSSGTTAFH
eukprot:3586424-Lingulodinium_polyedra.AAC.1